VTNPARTRSTVRRRRSSLNRDRTLWVLAVPGVIFFLVFSYAPLVGLVVAFKKFSIYKGIFGSPWNGLDNFRFFFQSGNAGRIIWNTVFLNVLFITSTIIVAIVLAIAINEVRLSMLRRFVQSSVFLPYFISPIVISIILQAFLAGVGGQGGIVNGALNAFSLPSVAWYSEPGPWPAILTVVKVWQLAGYYSVIYLAAITSIPEEVYEAGMLDGASRGQMALRLTLPYLMPVTVVLVMLSVGRIFFGDFGTIYAIIGDNGVLYPTTDVIDTYVFRALRTSGDFGMTAAIGLFQSVVGFILVAGAALVTRRITRETTLF
jgi:putative aldouronate transport system permease protein